MPESPILIRCAGMEYYPKSIEEFEAHQFDPKRIWQRLYDDRGSCIGWLFNTRLLRTLRIDSEQRLLVFGLFNREFVIWR
jgi:hypothetical protein